MERSNSFQNVFVIDSIHRPVDDVIPFKLPSLVISTWNYKEKAIKIENNIKPKINLNDNDSIKDVFYSDICRLTCTEETKNLIANHVSLWKHIVNNAGSLSDYILIIEDDNSITDKNLLLKLSDITDALSVNKIDMLQLVTHNKILRDVYSTSVTLTAGIEAYKGGFDSSLSAYLLNQNVIKKLYSYFSNNKPSFDISVELMRAEKTLDINRYIVKNDSIVTHDYSLKAEYRRQNKNTGIKNRLDNWLLKTYPSFYNRIHTPIFSAFGKYDITMLLLITLILIIGLAIFDVSNKLIWFFAGMLIAYSLY